MTQSKKQSFLEANLNTAAGFAVSLALGYFILPYFGVEQSIFTATKITSIFTLTSIARNYIVRRFFNYLNHSRRNKSLDDHMGIYNPEILHRPENNTMRPW